MMHFRIMTPWGSPSLARRLDVSVAKEFSCPVSFSAQGLQWPAAGSAIQGPASAREIANQGPASARASHAAGLARHDCKLEREKTRKRFEEVFGPLLQE